MVWAKGQSGNPKGRPKVQDDVAALARQHGPEAIARLVEWMRSDDAAASVKACDKLLERGFGKAPQIVDLNAKVEHLEVDALGIIESRIAGIAARAGKAVDASKLN